MSSAHYVVDVGYFATPRKARPQSLVLDLHDSIKVQMQGYQGDHRQLNLLNVRQAFCVKENSKYPVCKDVPFEAKEFSSEYTPQVLRITNDAQQSLLYSLSFENTVKLLETSTPNLRLTRRYRRATPDRTHYVMSSFPKSLVLSINLEKTPLRFENQLLVSSVLSFASSLSRRISLIVRPSMVEFIVHVLNIADSEHCITLMFSEKTELFPTRKSIKSACNRILKCDFKCRVDIDMRSFEDFESVFESIRAVTRWRQQRKPLRITHLALPHAGYFYEGTLGSDHKVNNERICATIVESIKNINLDCIEIETRCFEMDDTHELFSIATQANVPHVTIRGVLGTHSNTWNMLLNSRSVRSLFFWPTVPHMLPVNLPVLTNQNLVATNIRFACEFCGFNGKSLFRYSEPGHYCLLGQEYSETGSMLNQRLRNNIIHLYWTKCLVLTISLMRCGASNVLRLSTPDLVSTFLNFGESTGEESSVHCASGVITSTSIKFPGVGFPRRLRALRDLAFVTNSLSPT